MYQLRFVCTKLLLPSCADNIFFSTSNIILFDFADHEGGHLQLHLWLLEILGNHVRFDKDIQ